MKTKRKSTGWFFWLVMAALVVAGMIYFGRDGGGVASYVGRRLPPIRSSGTWLNTSAPLTWDQLRGDVVWLEFSFLR